MLRARTRLPDPSLRSPRVSPHLGTGAAPSSSTYGTAGRETGKSHPTSPILKGQVREPPDIAQPHCITHHGEDEIQLAGPVPSGFVFIPYIVFLKGEKKNEGGRSENSHGGKQPSQLAAAPRGREVVGVGLRVCIPCLVFPPPRLFVLPPGRRAQGSAQHFPSEAPTPAMRISGPGGKRRGEWGGGGSCQAQSPERDPHGCSSGVPSGVPASSCGLSLLPREN